MKKYVRVFKNEDFPNDISVLVLEKPEVDLNDLIYLDPCDYYHCPRAMKLDGVLAACRLNQGIGMNGIPFFYPNTSYVHPKYQGKGFGKLLYRTCLSTIRKLSYNKSDVEFRMHSATPYGVTNKSAKEIYHSLRRRGYIKRISIGRYSIIRWPRAHFKKIEELT